jgi:hypothetical protein
MRFALTLSALLCLSAPAFAQSPGDVQVLHAYLYSGSATEARNALAVQQLLAARPQVANAPDGTGTVLSSALDLAGVAGEIGRRARTLAGWLLARKANPDARVSGSQPLILKYAMFAQVEALELLVRAGADLKATDADGRTALHWVALLVEGDPAAPSAALKVRRFLRAATVLLDGKAPVDARDRQGVTPLAATAFLGNLELAKLLVSRGADVNAKDRGGESVLARVAGRHRERWANAREKALLPPVLAFLRSRGAR